MKTLKTLMRDTGLSLHEIADCLWRCCNKYLSEDELEEYIIERIEMKKVGRCYY